VDVTEEGKKLCNGKFGTWD